MWLLCLIDGNNWTELNWTWTEGKSSCFLTLPFNVNLEAIHFVNRKLHRCTYTSEVRGSLHPCIKRCTEIHPGSVYSCRCCNFHFAVIVISCTWLDMCAVVCVHLHAQICMWRTWYEMMCVIGICWKINKRIDDRIMPIQVLNKSKRDSRYGFKLTLVILNSKQFGNNNFSKVNRYCACYWEE